MDGTRLYGGTFGGRRLLVAKYRSAMMDPVSGLAAIWEQEPDDLDPTTTRLHLLTDEGIYLATLTLDEVWQDVALASGALLTLSRDPDTGRPEVHARQLVVPAR